MSVRPAAALATLFLLPLGCAGTDERSGPAALRESDPVADLQAQWLAAWQGATLEANQGLEMVEPDPIDWLDDRMTVALPIDFTACHLRHPVAVEGDRIQIDRGDAFVMTDAFFIQRGPVLQSDPNLGKRLGMRMDQTRWGEEASAGGVEVTDPQGVPSELVLICDHKAYEPMPSPDGVWTDFEDAGFRLRAAVRE